MIVGRCDHVRSNQVELEVSLSGEEIAVGFDHGGPEPPFEKRPGSMIRSVDVLDVPLPQALHQQSCSTVGFGRHQQMYMVGHQDIGVNAKRLARSERCQRIKENQIIRLGEEDRAPINAAKDGVHREAGSDNASMSGHADLLSLKGAGGQTVSENRGLSPVSHILEEGPLPSIAPLCHMVGQSRRDDSRKSCHAVAGASTPVSLLACCPWVFCSVRGIK